MSGESLPQIYVNPETTLFLNLAFRGLRGEITLLVVWFANTNQCYKPQRRIYWIKARSPGQFLGEWLSAPRCTAAEYKETLCVKPSLFCFFSPFISPSILRHNQSMGSVHSGLPAWAFLLPVPSRLTHCCCMVRSRNIATLNNKDKKRFVSIPFSCIFKPLMFWCHFMVEWIKPLHTPSLKMPL